jgi:hypothetical protein
MLRVEFPGINIPFSVSEAEDSHGRPIQAANQAPKAKSSQKTHRSGPTEHDASR